MRFKLTMLVLCVLFIPGSQSLAADGFVPLFDGQTLDGWTPLPGGTWKVSDGAIVGSQDSSESRLPISFRYADPYGSPTAHTVD